MIIFLDKESVPREYKHTHNKMLVRFECFSTVAFSPSTSGAAGSACPSSPAREILVSMKPSEATPDFKLRCWLAFSA